jgi:hypothetical protein
MEHRLTIHNMLQNDGVTELLNHCLIKHVWVCLIQARLLKSLRAEAVRFVIGVNNCTTTKVLGDITHGLCTLAVVSEGACNYTL